MHGYHWEYTPTMYRPLTQMPANNHPGHFSFLKNQRATQKCPLSPCSLPSLASTRVWAFLSLWFGWVSPLGFTAAPKPSIKVICCCGHVIDPVIVCLVNHTNMHLCVPLIALSNDCSSLCTSGRSTNLTGRVCSDGGTWTPVHGKVFPLPGLVHPASLLHYSTHVDDGHWYANICKCRSFMHALHLVCL